MSKNLRKSLLFIVATAFLVSLILSFSFFPKITYAEDPVNEVYYLTDVHQIKNLREHTNGQIFYYDTDGSGRFAMEYDVHVYRSASAPRLVPQNSQDAAFVWTAPESGVVYSALSSQDIVITDNKSTGFMVAQAKVYNGEIDPNFLDGGELVFYSNASGNNLNIADVIKTNTATSKGSSAAVGRIEMGFGTSANPISVRKGEQLMVIVRAVDTDSSNTATTDAAVLGRWKVNFKADGQSEYTSTDLCANLTGVTDETFLPTVNGLNFDFVSVGQSLVSFNAETSVSNLIEYELGYKRYREMKMIPPTTGQWNASGTVDSNWEIVTNGDTAKAVRISSSTTFDRAISFKAPANGTLQVDKLALTNSSFGSRQVPVDYAILLRQSSGEDYTYKYLYQPTKSATYESRNYCLAPSESKTLTNSDIPTVTVNKNDEVIFAIMGGSYAYSNSHVAIDIEISFKNGTDINVYTLNNTTPKITEQGVNNFYFIYFEPFTPLKEFNAVEDKTNLPVAFDGITIGLSEMIYKDNLWYVDANSVNHSVAVNGSVCKIASQVQKGAVVWEAPYDCKAWVSELYLSTGYSANNFVENHDIVGDGIRYSLVYVDNSGDAPKYYNLLNQEDWTLLDYSRNSSEVAEKELNVDGESNQIPSLMVKQGDMIMLINDCNVNSVADNTHLRFGIQYKSDTEEGLNKLSPDHSLISVQGTDNFYFYTAVLFNPLYNGEGFHDFGKVTEAQIPWKANGRGAGYHAFVKDPSGVYVQPASPNEAQKEAGSYNPSYFQTHMLKGQDTAFSFKAQSDCLAIITHAWVCKNMANNKTADGISVAFIYKSVVNGKATYTSLLENAWEHISVSSSKPIIKDFYDFPTVDMKAGDELLLVFDNYNTTPYDGTNAYMEITVQNKETKEFTFHSFKKDVTCYVDGRAPSLGPWDFKALKLSYDFSRTVIGEVSDYEYDVIDDFYTEQLEYFSLEKKYQSIVDPDLLVNVKNSIVTVSPGEVNALAIAYTVPKSGRIMLGAESFVSCQNDGTSNGIRIRIMKNDEIIYPTENGWRYYLDDTKHYIKNSPVISVEQDDILYFVIDSFGNALADTVGVDVIWHYAKDGDDYTESYVLSEGYSDTQGLNNWEYLEMSFGSDNYNGIIKVEKGGCSANYQVDDLVILAFALSIVFVIFVTKKRKGVK